MNQKAFTLIELIMVIVVLGIIAIIAIPTVTSIIRDSTDKTYDNQIKLLEDTARNYMSSNSTKLPRRSDSDGCNVSVSTLQRQGFLSKDDVLNPNYKKGSSDIDKQRTLNGAISVKWQNNKYVYKYTHTYSGNEC